MTRFPPPVEWSARKENSRKAQSETRRSTKCC
ncbi:hypothetical protein vBPaerPs25_114 [Pseudomonas phage vB_Paer_Ps25]|uniref:Uncharacterized protein n=1 Tax=Pseudomonas phage vB_Paer_Ps12 TaxID=2924904 RepID=A0AAE9KDK8_9CAUD|nr:hypothetical protein QE347_gp114 [Pseudomonas phage vB_Paer_Ps12]UOL47570.1 hypothetical protein vBPaerPs12_114 [Pseudomonas phage vB_Paer_Ps12]UOL47758.1 hypothetical protein vBPaerPs25_114 [Pseudomonas phage vB_Paer_Ps25]